MSAGARARRPRPRQYRVQGGDQGGAAPARRARPGHAAAHRHLLAETNTNLKIPARNAAGVNIGTTGRVAGMGADNEAVLKSVLGYSKAQIDALVEAEVLVSGQ